MIDNRPLVDVYHACCRTTFTARTFDKADEMHVDYHNVQYDKGRRTERIAVAKP